METSTINQAPNVPQKPPQIVRMEQERNEALIVTLAKIEVLRRELGDPTTLLAYGREYPIREGSLADTLVANAQALHGVAAGVLDEVKGVDYRLEEASVKIESLFAAYEHLMVQYAGILENNPKVAEMVLRMVPGMEAVTQATVREPANDSNGGGGIQDLDSKYAAA
jgi:hypothetical protein